MKEVSRPCIVDAASDASQRLDSDTLTALIKDVA
jgi:hypothetical protein